MSKEIPQGLFFAQERTVLKILEDGLENAFENSGLVKLGAPPAISFPAYGRLWPSSELPSVEEIEKEMGCSFRSDEYQKLRQKFLASYLTENAFGVRFRAVYGKSEWMRMRDKMDHASYVMKRIEFWSEVPGVLEEHRQSPSSKTRGNLELYFARYIDLNRELGNFFDRGPVKLKRISEFYAELYSTHRSPKVPSERSANSWCSILHYEMSCHLVKQLNFKVEFDRLEIYEKFPFMYWEGERPWIPYPKRLLREKLGRLILKKQKRENKPNATPRKWASARQQTVSRALSALGLSNLPG